MTKGREETENESSDDVGLNAISMLWVLTTHRALVDIQAHSPRAVCLYNLKAEGVVNY